jgi:hypothetical protein
VMSGIELAWVTTLDSGFGLASQCFAIAAAGALLYFADVTGRAIITARRRP